MEPVAGSLHLGPQILEAEEGGHVRLRGVLLRLDLDQLEGACFGRQGRAIGVVFEHGIGIAILCIGDERGALPGLVRWCQGGSTPVASGYGLQHVAERVNGQRDGMGHTRVGHFPGVVRWHIRVG